MNSDLFQALAALMVSVPGIIALVWAARARQLRRDPRIEYAALDDDDKSHGEAQPRSGNRSWIFWTVIWVLFGSVLLAPIVTGVYILSTQK